MNNIAPSLGEAIRVSGNQRAYRKARGLGQAATVDWMGAEQEVAQMRQSPGQKYGRSSAQQPEQPGRPQAGGSLYSKMIRNRQTSAL